MNYGISLAGFQTPQIEDTIYHRSYENWTCNDVKGIA